jgi:type III pantothenate kinase
LRRFFYAMNLIIDIGNTRTKIAFFQKNILIEKAIWESLSLESLSDILKDKDIEGVIMTVSGRDTEGVEAWLSARYFFIKLNHQTPIPIQNAYSTPDTLGKDRLAAAVAARYMYPKGHCLAIDAGTCITYNFINDKGVFLGGNIAPGLNMRLKAMHHFTAKLPLVAPYTEGVTWQYYGDTTEKAMLGGAQTGILAEVEGFVRLMKKQYKPLNVILTGGDGAYIFNNEKISRLHHEPNLVLIGLNQILNFNLNKK